MVQEQEIMRRERELDSTVRRPAEAEKFRLEKLAEATRNRQIMEAEADAESEILRGEAEAFAIEAKAKAEAEKMAKKADAWKEYKEAAILSMMLDSMPKVMFENNIKNHRFRFTSSNFSIFLEFVQMYRNLETSLKILFRL